MSNLQHDYVLLVKSGNFHLKRLLERKTILSEHPYKPHWIQISYDLKAAFGGNNSPNEPKFGIPHFSAQEITNEEHLSAVDFSELARKGTSSPIKLTPRWSKEKYIEQFNKVQHHLQRGDIYEMNLCMEFYAERVSINSFALFEKVYARTEAPFACLSKQGSIYLICASPERFLKREGSLLVSQPIKGTAKRHPNVERDQQLADDLRNNTKEQAENVMIVDLVRNDLSRIAKRGSVRVDELFGVQTFKTVHQLVSTVSCELKEGVSFYDILEATFPMGSMTGAPKIRAMQLIDELESHRRDLYSGSVGMYLPNGDFDLNVVIRSFVYNEETGYLSLSVGSAVTVYASAEQEYKECLLKAEALMACL